MHLLPVVVVLVLAGPAAQDDKALAKAHFETATRLYDVGEYERALAEFKAAYVAKPDPAFLFNIGQCYKKLGDDAKAMEFYQRFLAKAPAGDPNRVLVETRYRNAELDAVFKDDLERGAAAQAAKPVAPASPAAIAVPEPSSYPTLAVPEPLPVAPAPAAPALPPVVSTPAPPPQEPIDPGRPLRIAGIASGAAGVGSIGVALYFYARARSFSDKVSTDPNHTQADVQAGKNSETYQWVFYGLGGTALAAGGLLYWLGLPVAPTAGPGHVAISAGGTF